TMSFPSSSCKEAIISLRELWRLAISMISALLFLDLIWFLDEKATKVDFPLFNLAV
ncbi:14022_t:CDS:1, partial [Cetraspora pellucida]